MPTHQLPIRLALLLPCTLFFNNAVIAQRGDEYGPEFSSSISTGAGYLFLNGEYIAPPYELKLEEDVILLNGQRYTESGSESASYSRSFRDDGPRGEGWRSEGRRIEGGRGEGWRGGDRRDEGWRGGDRRGEGRRGEGYREEGYRGEGRRGVGLRGGYQRNPLLRTFRLLELLEQDAVILLSDERSPVSLHADRGGHEFLKYMLQAASDGGQNKVAVAGDSDSEVSEDWQQIASNFTPTPEFLSRAQKQVDDLHAVRAQVENELAAIKLSRRINYPLTMLALVVVVFSVGHLMTIAQPTFAMTLQEDTAEQFAGYTGYIVRSLTIIAVLSALDLFWTLLAHQIGSMREINPIGSKLISNPMQLLVFKIAVTSTAVGLLFWLRRLPFTRKATWWCCLVLTLLTVRWLTFHSMFT